MEKIKWSNSSSMKLSRAIVVVFVFILLGVDLGGWKLAEYIVTNAYSVTISIVYCNKCLFCYRVWEYDIAYHCDICV